MKSILDLRNWINNKKQRCLTNGVQFRGTCCSVLFFCGAIYLLFNGFSNYIERVKQRDWIKTDAVVISVYELIESNSIGLRHTTYRTVYNVEYQYDVDGNKHIGTIYHSSEKKKLEKFFK